MAAVLRRTKNTLAGWPAPAPFWLVPFVFFQCFADSLDDVRGEQQAGLALLPQRRVACKKFQRHVLDVLGLGGDLPLVAVSHSCHLFEGGPRAKVFQID